MAERLSDAMGVTALKGASLPAVTRKMTDDLTAIIGVGPKMAERLNALGIFEVRQLAEMAEDGVRALNDQLNGRPERDDWFGQARRLAGAPA
jgi:predicted flap endonuclease-1-like 5' DNA nuclease